MGLDTTHDCWHGSYGSFSRFRDALATAAGYDTDGWPDWPAEDPLILLIHHSDCDGFIHTLLCRPLAARIDELIPHLDPEVADRARQFSEGLKVAANRGEHVEFH